MRFSKPHVEDAGFRVGTLHGLTRADIIVAEHRSHHAQRYPVERSRVRAAASNVHRDRGETTKRMTSRRNRMKRTSSTFVACALGLALSAWACGANNESTANDRTGQPAAAGADRTGTPG